MVDRLFVGQFVGRNALGSIGLMFPLNNVTSAITVLLTIGGGALISLSLGRKEKDKNIDKGSQEADNPHGTMLPYLQKEIKQAGQYSEIFQ